MSEQPSEFRKGQTVQVQPGTGKAAVLGRVLAVYPPSKPGESTLYKISEQGILRFVEERQLQRVTR